MDPLSISASIAALLQLTSTVMQYLNAVKGVPDDRRTILSEVASVSGILYVLQDQADQAKNGDQWSSTLQSLNVPEGPLVQLRRALERLSSKLASPATGLKKLGKAITWPFQKEEIKEILASIERQKGLLNLARQNDHILLSRAIKDEVALVRDEVKEVAEGVSRLQISQITAEHSRIIDWLDVPDPSTNYNNALKARALDTGSWFIKSKAFADWKTTRGSLLWLHGIPGCGKTVLSSTILENVLDQHHTKPDTAVVYFYFDFANVKKQRHEKMIRSLIHQLFMHCANPVLQNLYSSCLKDGRQPTGEVLLTTLRQMMTSLRDTYIILDALDECTERDELLADLEEIVSWGDANLHVLTTSRRENDIEDALTPLTETQNCIGIRSSLVNADIRTYIHGRLQTDRKLKRWQKQPKVQLEIEDTLTIKAKGMFRWVTCQLDSLRLCFTLLDLRQTLDSLPKTLDDTYARILDNIDKDYNQYNRYIRRVLQWLTFSARPLRLGELAEIVIIEIDETPRFDPRRRWPEPRDILTICSSLIMLTSNLDDDSDEGSASELNEDSQYPSGGILSEAYYSDDSLNYIRLAHFSVKEYLVSDRIRHGKALHYSIREIESHGVIAEDCIAYLLQFNEPGSLTSETLRLSPLAHYAARFWGDHAKAAEKGPIETTTLLSMELLMADEEGLLNSIRISDPDRYGLEDLSRELDSVASPLYYASMAGLVGPAKLLIERNMDVNARGGKYGNTLQAAVAERHVDVVRLLLKSGADVNIHGGEFDNALNAACDCRHDPEDMVKLLLDKGADVNALGDSPDSALQLASGKGHENVIKVLIENGADVNACGRRGSALQLASENNHESVMRILIASGADINAYGGRGSALQLASEKGHEGVVRILIANGADVNPGSNFSEHCALQAASAYGNEGVVEILIANGADINALGGLWGSALQAASEYGHKGVVEILLASGADINAFSENEGSALQLASKNDLDDVVKVLIENGADINALGGLWGSALQCASENNHESVVKILIASGADVNASDDLGIALQAASKNGNEGVVKILIASGADVNYRGDYWGSPLQAASLNGHEDVVKILIASGADVNHRGDYWGSALQAASENGYENVVRILIASGANVNIVSNLGSSLQATSANGHENFVSILIENGADVNARGGDWGSALQAASRYGHKGVVEILIASGADVNAYGCRGSALQCASKNNHESVVKILIASGADVNARGGDWGSALQAASRYGHKGVVEILIANGAVMPEETEQEDDPPARHDGELDSVASSTDSE